MEQTNLANSCSVNSGTRRTRPSSTFLCPSDATSYTVVPNGGINYAANIWVFNPSGPASIEVACGKGTSDTVMFADILSCAKRPRRNTPPRWWAANTVNEGASGVSSIPGFGYATYAANGGIFGPAAGYPDYSYGGVAFQAGGLRSRPAATS